MLEEAPKGRIVGKQEKWEGGIHLGRGESGKREAGGIKTTKDDGKSYGGPLFYVYLKQHM